MILHFQATPQNAFSVKLKPLSDGERAKKTSTDKNKAASQAVEKQQIDSDATTTTATTTTTVQPKYKLRPVEVSYTDSVRTGCPSRRVRAHALRRQRLKMTSSLKPSDAAAGNLDARSVTLKPVSDAHATHPHKHHNAQKEPRIFCSGSCPDPDEMDSMDLMQQYLSKKPLPPIRRDKMAVQPQLFTGDFQENSGRISIAGSDSLSVRPRRSLGKNRRSYGRTKAPSSAHTQQDDADVLTPDIRALSMSMRNLVNSSDSCSRREQETNSDIESEKISNGIRRIQICIPSVGREDTLCEDEQGNQGWGLPKMKYRHGS